MIARSNHSGAVAHPRGRPLMMLAALLICWIGMRTALWESPFPAVQMSGLIEAVKAPVEQSSESAAPTFPPRALERGAIETRELLVDPLLEPLPAPWSEPAVLPSNDLATPPPLARQSIATATAHQLLYLAAMSNLPVPQFMAQRAVSPAGPSATLVNEQERPSADRWSLDAWVFWREGSRSALATAGRVPSYGASQTAGVLRYQIAPESRHDPRAYFRAYRALVEGGEGELASGLSARPIASLPVRAHAEIRATRFDSDWQIRPATFATTELAPVKLPGRTRAEIYLQGGYVGGDNATAFADGQVHVLRDVAKFDLGKLGFGAAAWGGAQEGAERFDVGPSLRLDLKIGEAPARFSLDWRERVAGDAAPDSGVALTLSTRF